MSEQGGKNKGPGPGNTNHGAKVGNVGNKCPNGAGKGVIGKNVGDPLKQKIRR